MLDFKYNQSLGSPNTQSRLNQQKQQQLIQQQLSHKGRIQGVSVYLQNQTNYDENGQQFNYQNGINQTIQPNLDENYQRQSSQGEVQGILGLQQRAQKQFQEKQQSPTHSDIFFNPVFEKPSLFYQNQLKLKQPKNLGSTLNSAKQKKIDFSLNFHSNNQINSPHNYQSNQKTQQNISDQMKLKQLIQQKNDFKYEQILQNVIKNNHQKKKKANKTLQQSSQYSILTESNNQNQNIFAPNISQQNQNQQLQFSQSVFQDQLSPTQKVFLMQQNLYKPQTTINTQQRQSQQNQNSSQQGQQQKLNQNKLGSLLQNSFNTNTFKGGAAQGPFNLNQNFVKKNRINLNESDKNINSRSPSASNNASHWISQQQIPFFKSEEDISIDEGTSIYNNHNNSINKNKTINPQNSINLYTKNNNSSSQRNSLHTANSIKNFQIKSRNNISQLNNQLFLEQKINSTKTTYRNNSKFIQLKNQIFSSKFNKDQLFYEEFLNSVQKLNGYVTNLKSPYIHNNSKKNSSTTIGNDRNKVKCDLEKLVQDTDELKQTTKIKSNFNEWFKYCQNKIQQKSYNSNLNNNQQESIISDSDIQSQYIYLDIQKH